LASVTITWGRCYIMGICLLYLLLALAKLNIFVGLSNI
jgi:hypothetical protein